MHPNPHRMHPTPHRMCPTLIETHPHLMGCTLTLNRMHPTPHRMCPTLIETHPHLMGCTPTLTGCIPPPYGETSAFMLRFYKRLLSYGIKRGLPAALYVTHFHMTLFLKKTFKTTFMYSIKQFLKEMIKAIKSKFCQFLDKIYSFL
ncbi:hypothetical protein BVtw_15760 [Bartonella vinsonii subsp. berkhoffii str. Tweed]|uniref:Uncharacterized protein n=1 Tax=Bartonella vinsonii subsp. berkhoffii str. Tweed TaxID=1094502 RepID=N6UKH9_BARVB|nr:hypothetical protein BVwin_13020 [Bartonella vinsonii subsp. berkhoffii str. Winnie]ENN92929.1 hypothetical protein BVtw_15760 [Bartonella vinsonii subsp. berkhoffii str. Tweed]